MIKKKKKKIIRVTSKEGFLMTEIDPSKYKEDQRRGWNNVAEG